ncbi:hypothetical protein CABS01_00449, partial [Colletotrichum abscissum]|uniref:uncharacterized protein n=1 Tax=Colletotrichum abscissum TaxID=1671311 RepID=UPI0027D4B512
RRCRTLRDQSNNILREGSQDIGPPCCKKTGDHEVVRRTPDAVLVGSFLPETGNCQHVCPSRASGRCGYSLLLSPRHASAVATSSFLEFESLNRADELKAFSRAWIERSRIGLKAKPLHLVVWVKEQGNATMTRSR